MNFRNWFEAEEPEKKHIGRQIYDLKGMWVGPSFVGYKKDQYGDWYFDWSISPGMIPDPEELRPGDEIGDNTPGSAINGISYWTVTQVSGNKVFVKPKDNNPFASGVGAGGAKWSQHDTDVASGEYERRRQEELMDAMQAKRVFNPSDVAYHLWGTIPTHIGPNLTQGGSYHSNSSHNRATEKHPEWTAADVQKVDAATLKKYGFLVPDKALEGKLKAHDWDEFVRGQGDASKNPDLMVQGEDFSNPQTCAKMVITAKEPYLKRRNLDQLYNLYTGYTQYRKDMHQIFEYMRGPEMKEKFWEVARRHGLQEGDREIFDQVWKAIYNGYILKDNYRPDSAAEQAFQIELNHNEQLKSALQEAHAKMEADQDKWINDLQEHWEKGDYTDNKVLPVMKFVAKSMVDVFVPNQKELAAKDPVYAHYDPYFSTKRYLVDFAAQQKWGDIVDLYRDSFDTETKDSVFNAYKDLNNQDGMWYMLNKENHPENLARFVYELGKTNESEMIDWIHKNLQKVIKIINSPRTENDGAWDYHSAELLKTLFHYAQRGYKKDPERSGKLMMTLLNTAKNAEALGEFMDTLIRWDGGKYRDWVKLWAEKNDSKIQRALQGSYTQKLQSALDNLEAEDEDEV